MAQAWTICAAAERPRPRRPCGKAEIKATAICQTDPAPPTVREDETLRYGGEPPVIAAVGPPPQARTRVAGRPPGSSDFGGVIARLPDDADAIHLGVGAADAIDFPNR